jgi:hypothetical protein
MLRNVKFFVGKALKKLNQKKARYILLQVRHLNKKLPVLHLPFIIAIFFGRKIEQHAFKDVNNYRGGYNTFYLETPGANVIKQYHGKLPW